MAGAGFQRLDAMTSIGRGDSLLAHRSWLPGDAVDASNKRPVSVPDGRELLCCLGGMALGD